MSPTTTMVPRVSAVPVMLLAEWDRRITQERHYVAPVADQTTSAA